MEMFGVESGRLESSSRGRPRPHGLCCSGSVKSEGPPAAKHAAVWHLPRVDRTNCPGLCTEATCTVWWRREKKSLIFLVGSLIVQMYLLMSKGNNWKKKSSLHLWPPPFRPMHQGSADSFSLDEGRTSLFYLETFLHDAENESPPDVWREETGRFVQLYGFRAEPCGDAALLRLWKGQWDHSDSSALRLRKFVAVDSRRLDSVVVVNLTSGGSCGGRKNICMYVSLCLSSISNLPFASSPSLLHSKLIWRPLNCVPMKPFRSRHISIPLFSGEILFFSGHCSSSPARHSRSAELPSDSRPLLRPHLENKSINPKKKNAAREPRGSRVTKQKNPQGCCCHCRGRYWV